MLPDEKGSTTIGTKPGTRIDLSEEQFTPSRLLCPSRLKIVTPVQFLSIQGRTITLTTGQRCTLCSSDLVFAFVAHSPADPGTLDLMPPSGAPGGRRLPSRPLTAARPSRMAQPPWLHTGRGEGVLAISGSVVWSGNQNDFLVNFAQRLKFCIKRSLCGPHNQNPVIWFQEFQHFGKLLFQTLRFHLVETERKRNELTYRKKN